MADRMRMVPGLALELTMKDGEGSPWEFNDPKQRKRAEQVVMTHKSALLNVCPNAQRVLDSQPS